MCWALHPLLYTHLILHSQSFYLLQYVIKIQPNLRGVIDIFKEQVAEAKEEKISNEYPESFVQGSCSSSSDCPDGYVCGRRTGVCKPMQCGRGYRSCPDGYVCRRTGDIRVCKKADEWLTTHEYDKEEEV